MRARTIIAAPVIWFGSWLLSLMSASCIPAASPPVLSASGNKKGPQEAPCAPPDFGWQSATPGDAPGYDGDKEFGNNITHLTAHTSQRLRELSHQHPNVKARCLVRPTFGYFSGVPAVRRVRKCCTGTKERHRAPSCTSSHP